MPPFSSHLDLAHLYWKLLLNSGDAVVDATCGNGKDTLFLAQTVLGKKADSGLVVGIDIQKKSIENTHALLKKELTDLQLSRVHLFNHSHIDFPEIALLHPVKLIVYNLGYLPGGDKTLTTKVSSTLESVRKALQIIAPQGAVSITCYPGHAEGAEEKTSLLKMSESLDPQQWDVSHSQWLNRSSSPSLLFIQKKILN
jgi:hypothetical protein